MGANKEIIERTGAESVRWNLSDLYPDTQALKADLKRAREEAEGFAQTYRGKVATLSPEAFVEAIRAFERIQEQLGRAYTYAYLTWATATDVPEHGALLQEVREQYAQIMQELLFFELEWVQMPEDKAQEMLASEPLQPYRHYLELQRLYKPHVLSEPEEKVLAEKSVTGRAAWNRLFDETLARARFPFRGELLTEQEILAKLHDPDRSVRRDAALGFTEGLEPLLPTLTYVFNTVLADKASDDRLRKYPHWLASRNLSNEITDEAVEALVEAVTGRYDLVARFYRLKRELLGLEQLYDYDRYAPIGESDTYYSWEEARDLVLEAYEAFHPELSTIARLFFEKNWIDAAVTPGKRGGAFSHGAVPAVHPYILMNYTGKIRDVQTLAHELGHGVHQYLSRKQGYLQSDTPLTTAETASVFGEMLVFQRLMEKERDPKNRLAMLVGKIDDTMATVFRQIAMNRFEDRIHTSRRQEGELTADAFGEHWITTQEQMFQGSVTLGKHYQLWWSYIPHFIHTPGYVYAYAFGELLVLALYARYMEEGESFAQKYLQLLEAGGSDWTHRLVGKLGVDLNDPGFWSQGLQAIENWIAEAEQLAREKR